jgi:hypothetical protein
MEKNIKYENGLIKCICPDCNAIANFDYKSSSREFGYISIDKQHQYNGQNFSRIVYNLFSCTGCGRGGIAKIHCNNSVLIGEVEDFYPVGIDKAKVPSSTPKEILVELHEAELCASVQAWRAGSAMLRSVLEKLLTLNGYSEKRLVDKIDAANKDGIITDSRTQKAHNEIRVLGNDILHDEWKAVTEEDFTVAYHYCQRIIEDFYDDRNTVENILKTKSKI